MLQKILIAFVTLMLAACLLTGCGEKGNDSNTATTDTATQAATVTDEKSTASEVELKPSKSGATDNKRFGTGSDTSSDSGQSSANDNQSNQQSGGNSDSGSGAQSQSGAGSSQGSAGSGATQSQDGSSSKPQGGSDSSQYTSAKKSDKTYMGRFTFDMIKDFTGFNRVFTILACGFIFHGRDGSVLPGDPYERVSLEITEFDNEDVIATSGVIPSSTIPPKPYYGDPFI